MGEKLLSVVFAIVVLAVAGFAIAKAMHHSKTVAPATKRQMIAAVLKKEPGAAVTTSSCGSSSCTIYVRKGATHACDGWMASIGADGQVLLVGVGKKSC